MDSRHIHEAVGRAIEKHPLGASFRSDLRDNTFTLVKEVLNQCEGKPEDLKLLDIGAGAMAKTAAFRELGFHCWAADDLSDEWHLLGDNRDRIQEFTRQVGIEFHLQDENYLLPYDAKSFDVVLLTGVIEHLHESPRELLGKALELLKTGGSLVVVMPNSVNLRKRFSVLAGRTNYCGVEGFFQSKGLWRGHVREYTLKETEYIVRACGGEVVASKTFHNHLKLRIRFPLFRLAYRLITWCFPQLRDGLLVVSRRPTGWKPVHYSEEAYRKHLRGYLPTGFVPDDPPTKQERE